MNAVITVPPNDLLILSVSYFTPARLHLGGKGGVAFPPGSNTGPLPSLEIA